MITTDTKIGFWIYQRDTSVDNGSRTEFVRTSARLPPAEGDQRTRVVLLTVNTCGRWQKKKTVLRVRETDLSVGFGPLHFILDLQSLAVWYMWNSFTRGGGVCNSKWQINTADASGDGRGTRPSYEPSVPVSVMTRTDLSGGNSIVEQF